MKVVTNTLTAIYFCDAYPGDRSLFSAMSLYFDEVHFVSPSDDVSSKETYTKYLSQLDGETLKIGILGDVESPEAKREIARVAGFYQFVLDIKPLIGHVVHFHPNLQAQEIRKISDPFLRGGLEAELWNRFIARKTPEAETLAAFARDHPELDDEVLLRLLPTARDLAAQHGYIPVSDNVALPVPLVARGAALADVLASSAGLAVLSITLPSPLWTSADDILEVREKLKDEIKAFRTMSLKLASRLRGMVQANADLHSVRQQAEFLAKTEVLPHVEDIRRRIDAETGKLWRRLFGAGIRWLSIGLSSYADPSGTMVIKAIKDAGSDISNLTESAHGVSLAGDTGISLLFRLEERLRPQRE